MPVIVMYPATTSTAIYTTVTAVIVWPEAISEVDLTVYRQLRTVRSPNANHLFEGGTCNANVIILHRHDVRVLVLLLTFVVVSQRSGTCFPRDQRCEDLCIARRYQSYRQHPDKKRPHLLRMYTFM